MKWKRKFFFVKILGINHFQLSFFLSFVKNLHNFSFLQTYVTFYWRAFFYFILNGDCFIHFCLFVTEKGTLNHSPAMRGKKKRNNLLLILLRNCLINQTNLTGR